MPVDFIRSRPPRGEVRAPRIARDERLLASVMQDAARFPGGHAAGLASPASEGEIAALLREEAAVLPIGAQSSLTGGATPMGEVVIGTARLDRVLEIGEGWVRVQPGVTIAELDEALAPRRAFYPPAPTFAGATIGGTVATNAAGAATFKYGTTRDWVEALTVVLSSGDVLDLRRGEARARAGRFDLKLGAGTIRIEVPRYRMPALPKLSAGYFAAPDMDLIDLFIGAEGTLGIVTEITLRTVPDRPAACLALASFANREAALGCVATLRREAAATWRTRDPCGIDAAAMEGLDARSLALLREDGVDRRCGVVLPAGAAAALLVTLELPSGATASQAYEEIGRAREPGAADGPLVRFCRLLDGCGVLGDVEMALPGDAARSAQLIAVREAIPAAVNQRVGRAAAIDPRIEKTAGDFVVPFDRLGELLAAWDAEIARRGLDGAVWGHVSDGNVHPNVIPATFADVASGKAAVGAVGRVAIALGGSPLAEHGVGRSAVKQRLLADLYGEEAIDQMRRVKRALDPSWKLAPGVLFRP
ncbi:MAG: FAD-binding oxidoreductase [Acidobacteria bacterium]|nr:FAD-binding oxidoreductase [Acidobacteriota bacterium]